MSVAMQVSVEKTGQHERKLNVSIPADRVEKEINDRLVKLSKTARISGFRKGKIPMNVIKKRFGEDARHEAISNLIQTGLYDAIKQESLVLANTPTVDITSDAAGNALEFNAVFEVYPQIELKGLDTLNIEKPEIDITESDLTEALEKMAKQFTTFEAVERASKDGDQLTVDLTGTLTGEEEPFTTAPGMTVELGGGNMIPGFEDNLQNVSKDQTVTFEVPFPADYWEAKLAGKPATFECVIKEVAEPKRAEIDDALAEKMGFKEGGLEKLKERLKEGLLNEAKHIQKQQLKEVILDQLLKVNTVDVPESLIKTELEMLEKNPGMAKLEENESLEDNAKRRVTLSLLLGQYIKQEKIELDYQRVQQAVREMARNYPDPDAIMKWFYQDQQRLSGVASMVLEDQAIEKILEGVKPSDKKLSYKEIAEK